MASKFRIPDLRDRFDDWLSARKEAGDDSPAQSSIEAHLFEVVEDPESAFDLSQLLENLVIPKLIAERDQPVVRLSEQGFAETVGTERKRPITDEDILSFALLSIESEASTLLDFIDNCLATGSSVEDIYVDLLAPTARKLGQFWEEDSKDFIDVTMGLWRIQEVLRELTLRIPPPSVPGQGQRSALFSTLPGEQHSLGTLIVAECFQRAGWDTEVLMEPTQAELTAKFVKQHFDLAGLTISRDCPTETLSGLINVIRSISSNPGIRIMIGGQMVNTQSRLVEICGADGTAEDAPSAIEVANALVPLNARAHGPLNS